MSPLQNLRTSKLATNGFAPKSDTHHMMTSQFRSGRRKEPFGKPNGEKTGDFERFLPFFRPCIFSEFHRSLLPFSMLCPDSDSRKGLFASSRKQSVLWLDSDLRKRSRTVRKSLAFKKFYKATGCKKISD